MFGCLFYLVSSITHVNSRTDVDERAAGTLRSISLLPHSEFPAEVEFRNYRNHRVCKYCFLDIISYYVYFC